MPTTTPKTTPDAPSRSRRGGALLKPVLVLAALAVVAGGTYVALRPSSDADNVVMTAELSPASFESFEITTLSTGELEARNRIELRSELDEQSSSVESIPEGTRVEAGEVLVRLNSDPIENEVAEDELRVVEARNNYEAAVTAEQIQISENASRLRQAESRLKLARLALEEWEQGQVVQTRKRLALDVEKAEKNLERLSEKYDQSQQLYGREFLSKDELDRDEINFIDARAALEQAQIALDVYEKFQHQKDAEQFRLDLEEAESELVRVRKENEVNLNNRRATLASRQRQLQLREENLNELKEQLDLCVITAPSDGLVVYGTSTQRDSWRNQNEGGLAVGRAVRPNDLLIVLPDTSEMIASVKVHESLAGRVRAGQPASVRIDALGRDVPGIVESVGVLAETGGWRDPNRREYTVRIALDTEGVGAELKPTMRCEARITLDTVDDALRIPVAAVFNEGPVRYVYSPRGTRFVRTPVRVGRLSSTDAEVLGGLEEGDLVLLREPAASEVLDEPWTDDALVNVGYRPRTPPAQAQAGGRPAAIGG